MRRLINPIKAYAWGSHTAIAAMQGRGAAAQPEAELWMGAHPSAPSIVEPDQTPLDRLIADNPVGELGADVMRRFDARLPYLLKVLAAAQPLSLQVHPNAEQARAGYAAQQDSPASGAPRVYADPYHKPELLVALDDFEALCGFRDPHVSADVIESFKVPALEPVVRVLRGPQGEALRQATRLLFGSPEPHRRATVAALASAARHGDDEPAKLVRRLADLYPGDIGVVVALLLHHVRLLPGEAVFMSAGNLHAYLGGTGVEVMAASDNVLRGGLTVKHVDVAELMRILRFDVHPDPLVSAEVVAPGVISWPVPVGEFRLIRAQVRVEDGRVRLPGAGPRIVLCVSGAASVETDGSFQPVRGGEALYLSATEPEVAVHGDAVVFQVAPAEHS